MFIGYIRVSKSDGSQVLDLQKDALIKSGIESKYIYEDLAFGRKDHAFPDAKFGFSTRNLWDMRRLYVEYKDFPKLRQLVAEIPWGQKLMILNKIKNEKERHYYLAATKEEAWTRDTLRDKIHTNSYERHRLSPKHHNFNRTLPEALAIQADQSMKDVYMFDMLRIAEPVIETEIERRMVEKIQFELGVEVVTKSDYQEQNNE
jgi:predicted nuclease of restriction endonuclease-like (RecB) superfamily